MIPISKVEKLFKDHCRSAVLYSHRIVGEKETAEDIVHNVFLKLMSDDISIRSSLETYLYSAVHNRSIDFLRRKRTIQGGDMNEIPEYTDPAEYPDDENFERVRQIKKLHEAIEALPCKCRKVFIMVQLERLSYKETAESLNISVNTVRTQMHRAMRYLKQSLNMA